MNVKNIVKKFTLVSLATLGIVASSNTVIAQQTEESNATIEFTNPEVGNVDIQDPSTDGAEGTLDTPSDKGKVGTPNSLLSLDYVTHLDFATHEVDQAGGTYNTVTEKPFVQVSDRRQTGEGWNLTAQLGNFSSGGNPTLVGSTITFKNANVQTPGPGTNAPTANGVTLTAGEKSAQKIASATAKTGSLSTAQGLGTWLIDWIKQDGGANDNVTLTVPANEASEGQHSATITWTLTSGPGQ
ncbi:WxL domain-containing protein [Dolosigranulum pigrum]|uniref:WxL domain-containing protein n=1 Tax=Dolosigranulum pigrum TaxID=29394 RepID=UPI000DC3C004|nr:WxL domain-containing protein [Dolosigranulum pigrum]QJS97269.1 WxL domain-containing protein [Dolosigranulum pigrum]